MEEANQSHTAIKKHHQPRINLEKRIRPLGNPRLNVFFACYSP